VTAGSTGSTTTDFLRMTLVAMNGETPHGETSLVGDLYHQPTQNASLSKIHVTGGTENPVAGQEAASRNRGPERRIPEKDPVVERHPHFSQVAYLSRVTGAVASWSGPEKPNIDHVLHS
jgi:hypothetical protein